MGLVQPLADVKSRESCEDQRLDGTGEKAKQHHWHWGQGVSSLVAM